MVTMRKDNVFRIVHSDDVQELELRGFVIVEEDEGGQEPPSAPTPAIDDEPKEPEQMEHPQVTVDIGNRLMLDGLYGQQMNKTMLIAWHKREGFDYQKNWDKKELMNSYTKHAREIKAGKKGR